MIRSLGVGSGLDLDRLVQQIVAAERQPVASRINRSERRYQAELSALGEFKGALSSLQTAVGGLAESGAVEAGRRAESSQPELFGATAESSAVPGTYSIEVVSLARAAKLASDPFADAATPVGTGVLEISLGGDTFDLQIDSSNNTLSGIRDAINAAEDNPGIAATIINEAAGSRLVLTGSETGAENAITVTASGGDGGLSSLVYDPDGAGTTNLTLVDAAEDALVRVEGFDHYSASNSVTGVIDDVTLDLGKADPGNVQTLTISETFDSAKSRLQRFISKYNALAEVSGRLTAYDPESGQAGPLQGDAGVRGVLAQLRNILSSQVGETFGSRDSLAVFGVTTDAGGKLQLDESRLDAVLAERPDALDTLLAGSEGIATRLESYLGSVLGSDDLIASREAGIKERLEGLQDDRARLDARLEQIEERYVQQFSALDSLVAQLNQTSSFLEQQLSNTPLARK